MATRMVQINPQVYAALQAHISEHVSLKAQGEIGALISTDPNLMDEMIKKAGGKRTIPQIFFEDHHVGGYQELRELEKSGTLLNNLK